MYMVAFGSQGIVFLTSSALSRWPPCTAKKVNLAGIVINCYRDPVSFPHGIKHIRPSLTRPAWLATS